MPFSLLILASNSSKRITCTRISSIDHKQSETVYDCVSISLFRRFFIATRCQQDVTIDCDHALGRCLRLFATELILPYGNIHMETAAKKFRMISHVINRS